jgi:transcriptional regulator with XRE-family HTH domain
MGVGPRLCGKFIIDSSPPVRVVRLNQRDLAERAGMSQSTIVLLERRGRNERFHPSTVRKLSEGLGVEPAELLEN